MPIIECTAPFVDNNKNSFVVKTYLLRSSEKLVFAKSICKTIEYQWEGMHGHDFLKLEVPQWLLSKMIKEYNLDDYKIKIIL